MEAEKRPIVVGFRYRVIPLSPAEKRDALAWGSVISIKKISQIEAPGDLVEPLKTRLFAEGIRA